MRFSIRLAVIILPAAFACWFASVSSQQQRAQTHALTHFRSALRDGLHADPDILYTAFGRARCRELMIAESSAPDVVFDGQDRWCQIVRAPNGHGGQGDEYTLFSLADGFHRTRTLPAGAILKSITLKPDQVVFKVYGDIETGPNGKTRHIAEESPETYRFPWSPGSKPPAADINTLLYTNANSSSPSRQ